MLNLNRTYHIHLNELLCHVENMSQDETGVLPICISLKTLQSPFATLKFDHLHHAFAEYLSLLDLVSTASASHHFNRYAAAHIFPRYTTLDLTNQHDFPASNELMRIHDFRRILQRIGRYVRTAILGHHHLPNAPVLRNQFLYTLLLACPHLLELRLDEFNVRCSSFRQLFGEFNLSRLTKLQFISCRGNAINRRTCHQFANLRQLELTGIRMQSDHLFGLFANLDTLIVTNTFVTKSYLVAALARNARTLRRLSLTRLLGFHWGTECQFWQTLPLVVPNVTDLALCQPKLMYVMESGAQFEWLEVDRPLDDALIDVLPRFAGLRRLTASYNLHHCLDANNAYQLQSALMRLLTVKHLEEVHLVVDNKITLRHILQTLAALRSTADGEHHLHVFVYNSQQLGARRWLAAGVKTWCKWTRRRWSGIASCDTYHLVDRSRRSMQCGNLQDC